MIWGVSSRPSSLNKKKRTMQSDGVIRVSFTLNYGSKLSQAETKPSIFCYFSDQIKNKGVEVDVPENDASHLVNVTIEGTFDSRKPLPVDTEICFRATCWRKNDYGIDCRVEAGLGVLSLNELVLTTASSSSFKQDVALKDRSTGGRAKGLVRIIAAKKQVNIDSRIRWESSVIGSPLRRIGSANDQPLPIEQEMVAYIRAVMQTEMSFPNTYSETANVRIPIYFGNVGMMRPDTPLPAAAFFLCKTPESNTRFWENVLQIAMAREGCVLTDYDRMPLTRQSSLMTDAVCAVIHVSPASVQPLLDSHLSYPLRPWTTLVIWTTSTSAASNRFPDSSGVASTDPTIRLGSLDVNVLGTLCEMETVTARTLRLRLEARSSRR